MTTFFPPELAWLDMNRAYHPDAPRKLWTEYHRGLLSGRDVFDPSWYDRQLDWIFDGDPVIGVQDAIVRFVARGGGMSPEFAGEILGWGILEGIIVPDAGAEGFGWRRLRHDVTFVPRWPHALDVRVNAPSGGVLSRTALASREAKRRVTDRRKVKEFTLEAMHREMAVLDGRQVLPAALRAIDLPPVSTVDEFRANFAGFQNALTAWRVMEVYWHIHQIWKEEEQGRRLSPPELDDLVI